MRNCTLKHKSMHNVSMPLGFLSVAKLKLRIIAELIEGWTEQQTQATEVTSRSSIQ